MIFIYTIILCFEVGYYIVVVPIIVALSALIERKILIWYLTTMGDRGAFLDQRNKLTEESLRGIKMVKLNAWEDVIRKAIFGIRSSERYFLKKIFFIQSILGGIAAFLPHLCALTIFILFIILRPGELTVAKIFAILAIFGALISPIRNLMFAQINQVNANLGCSRAIRLLQIYNYQERLDSEDLEVGEISLEKCSFAAEDNHHKRIWTQVNTENIRCPDILHEITFKVHPQQFIGVIGPLGSSKSALLRAIMGQLRLTSGTIKKNGKIAYISQEPFILKDTFRANIIFGMDYDIEKYKRAIKFCELGIVINALPGGDLTEIGENGISLSGGQKQRVGIARAVYADADIYIIDSPLSALDFEIGTRILKNVFLGVLAQKTRIMCTQNLRLLRHFDMIYMMDEGKIDAFGVLGFIKYNKTFLSLFDQDGTFNEKEFNYVTEEILRRSILGETGSNLSPSHRLSYRQSVEPFRASKRRQVKQVLNEDQRTGLVPFGVYTYYLKNIGYFNLICMLLLYGIYSYTAFRIDFLVGQWPRAEEEGNGNLYRLYYCALLFVIFCLLMAKSWWAAAAISRASFEIFDKMMNSLLKRPMRFFDTTQIGTILNRCTNDLIILDTTLPRYGQIFLESYFLVGSTFIILAVVSPIHIAILFIFLFFLYRSVKTYMLVAIEMKRMGRAALGPMLNIASEMLRGITHIRVWKREEKFSKKFLEFSNLKAVVDFHEAIGDLWLKIRVEYPIALVISLSIVGITLGKKSFLLNDFDLAIIGVLFMYLVNVSNYTGLLIWSTTTLMREMAVVERIKDYTDTNDIEEAEDHNLEKLKSKNTEIMYGGIRFQKVWARYSKDKQFVLRGVTLDIKAGEKVGIIGKTGSGKSSIFAVLTRMINLEILGDGNVEIDGTNIEDFCLKDLRNNIVTISQDPIVLSGTLQYNVDPLGLFSKEEVVEALRKVEIFQTLRFPKSQKSKKANLEGSELNLLSKDLREEHSVEEYLDYIIESNGVNLSVGQKQMICIARALLKKAKILLLDEATANIDKRHDHIFQELIKNEMKNVTILSIAHRLDTVADYDKIAVLDEGSIIEYGAPQDLIRKKGYYWQAYNENNLL